MTAARRKKTLNLADLKFEILDSFMPDSYGGAFVFAMAGKKEVGDLSVLKCNADTGYSSVNKAWVAKEWQGRGVYPTMLLTLRDYVKAKGCKGIRSVGWGRMGVKSTASWEKFAKREPRVRSVETDMGTDYYLDGLGKLPKRGRIPLAVVKRAAAKLPKWTRKCGFTIAQLREGMETEREHSDVTKRGAFKTAQIAAAHLCEFKGGGYYPGLKKLERRLKRGG